MELEVALAKLGSLYRLEERLSESSIGGQIQGLTLNNNFFLLIL